MRRLTTHRLLSATVLALSLAACGDKSKPAEGDASGEVLEGTISDDMLPLEQLQSRAPLAEPSAAATGASSAAAGENGDAADEAAPAEGATSAGDE